MSEPKVLKRPLLKTVTRKPRPDEYDDPDTIKSRLSGLIQAVLEESSFDPMIKRIVSKMILNFLANARDEALKEKIENIRDEIIPFILTGEARENATTQDSHSNR